ncbi:dnaJ subfamily C member 30 [Biomphalaria glabrata]|nr:dnaJ subfamily C member 30 [Biomphalaria glabrata]
MAFFITSSSMLLANDHAHCVLKAAAGILPFFLTNNVFQRRYVSRATPIKSTSHYYDVLGITPSATQTQIKSAYYKMSKLHHPDVTECKNSHSLFTEISEAYEVLGNVRKRRLYDKGVYNPRQMNQPSSREDNTTNESESHEDNARGHQNYYSQRDPRPPPPRGRSRIYNFDEFYRMHYNDVREKRANEYKEYLKYQEMLREERQIAADKMPLSLVFVVWCIFFATVITIYENYDVNVIDTRKKARNGTGDPLKFLDKKDV